jgi:hypothetical protein
MNSEKKRVAEELFPQKGMPYTRLKKEFLTADYAIEVKEPLHWVISKTVEDIPLVLDVKISESYPHVAPEVIVLSPKPFILKTSHYSVVKLLNQFFTHALQNLRDYRPAESIDTPPPIQEVIDLAKATKKPIFLVMGSHPGENPVGRKLYSNPQLFLLDEASGSGDTSRFFKIDFTKREQMNWLCSQLPGAFEAVILDASTMKFFTPHPDKPQEQLAFLEILECMYRLLSDTGIFFMAEPGSSYGGIVPMKKATNSEGKSVWVRNTSPQPGAIMKEMVESVGFHTESKTIDEISHSLVDLVHKDRIDKHGAKYFLVARKVRTGGKRKTRRRKVNRRKRTRTR